MVQQMISPKFGEYGLGRTEQNFSAGGDKQFPVAVKKAALRDVQNQNSGHNFISNSPLTKNSGKSMDTINKVSGTKRPSPESPIAHNQSPNGNAANAQLVYVRRKSEAETGKINANSPNRKQVGHSGETNQLKSPTKEQPKVSRFSAFMAPMPVSTTISTSGKPSVSLPITQSPITQSSTPRFASVQSTYHPFPASSVPLSDNGNAMRVMHWEERYCQLQALLKKIDQSDQEDYIQMLRSISSVELSRHAVELEKRSIQLSLEEAKEIQRVAFLNVLGRNLKAPPTIQQRK
ncbi:unnamed protein product [Linum tenue]|uniref:Uncharacterized protein n=1 Tax=Linum tenue TaxID=586396 RepID=A0AAV0PF20_9ROSI|nr:unnamed protein product [Linum tenue]